MKKKGFPFGIMMFLIALLLALSGLVSAGYFYYATKTGVSSTVAGIRENALPLAEALSSLAGMSYKLRDYSNLKVVFQKKIEESAIDEAFFVLGDGTLIVHSNREVESSLKGNIANDEFAYNTDLILQPFRKRSEEAQFIDYNIIEKKVPFRRLERHYLKQYIYDRIDTSGWLVSRAVFAGARGKEEPVGTVNFIISKERVFSVVFDNLDKSMLILKGLAVVSILLSLIVALLIFLRYRNYYRFATVRGESVNGRVIDIEKARPRGSDYQDSVTIDADKGGLVEVDDSTNAWRSSVDGSPGKAEVAPLDVRKPVRDAIPVKKRRA